MNTRERIFSEVITLKVSPEEKEKIKNFLCKKKKDKLGEKLREFILQAIDEKNPLIEYSIAENEGIINITFSNGKENDTLYFNSLEDVLKLVKVLGAKKKEGE
jgi:type IV secretory pathway ATPase VirB11/archaellum biosynthesis ATPase